MPPMFARVPSVPRFNAAPGGPVGGGVAALGSPIELKVPELHPRVKARPFETSITIGMLIQTLLQQMPPLSPDTLDTFAQSWSLLTALLVRVSFSRCRRKVLNVVAELL